MKKVLSICVGVFASLNLFAANSSVVKCDKWLEHKGPAPVIVPVSSDLIKISDSKVADCPTSVALHIGNGLADVNKILQLDEATKSPSAVLFCKYVIDKDTSLVCYPQ